MVPAALAAALLVGDLLEAIGAEDFRGATTAFGPALALLPLAPLMSLVMQISTLRLRPGLRLRATAAGTAVFAAAAVALVPWMGAPGATSALLAGTGVTVLAAARMLPGVVSARLAAAAVGGAALVVLVGVLVG
jgi:O-antigen/teichoic acid export membrane protein